MRTRLIRARDFERQARMIGLLVLCCGLFVSCGSSGGGAAAPGSCLSYGAAGAAAANTVVARQAAGASCDLIAVEFVVTGVSDLFATAFTVQFDSAVVSYESLTIIGSVLSSDGAALQVIEQESAGQVVIGITRVASTGIATDGILVTLIFRRLAASGTSPLSFTGESLLDSSTPPAPIASVWFGGTFTIN